MTCLRMLVSCLLFAGSIGNLQASTLYEDLGGKDGLQAVIDQFLWNVADNPYIKEHFVETNVLRLREKLTEYVCRASDGPCTYTGDTLPRAHANLGITIADFNALVESLILAMESQDIPTGVQNRLLQVLARDYPDVVGVGPGAQ